MTAPRGQVSQGDEEELAAEMRQALAQRDALLAQLSATNERILRLEGALLFVRGKLGDGQEAVQAAGEAAEPAGVSQGEARPD